MTGFLFFLLACSASQDPDTADTASPADTETKDTGTRDPVKDLDPSSFPNADDACREPELFWVKDVLDGDTIRVEGKWGGETVRLIGINAPEMDWDTQAHDCWGQEALNALQTTVLNQWVWLLFDENCEDDFGRTLAYVHRGSKLEDFIQRALIRNGHVEAYKVKPNDHFETLFNADETFARNENNGLWGKCN